MAALAAWSRWLAPGWLVVAAAGAGASVAVRARAGAGQLGTAGAVTRLLLVLAIALAFAGEWDLLRRSGARPGAAQELRAVLESRLADHLDAVEARAVRAAGAAAGVEGELEGPPFPEVDGIPSGSGVDAVALVGPRGELRAWAGEHRGGLPPELRRGRRRLVAGGPLFSYLYVARPVSERGGISVAAVLLRAKLPGSAPVDEGGALRRFEAQTGARVTLVADGAPASDAAWSLDDGGETVAVARLTPPAQRIRQGAVAERWSAGVGVVALALVGLGLVAWRREGEVGGMAPAAGALAALLVLPLGSITGLEALFGPVAFLTPGPVDLTLGRLAVAELFAVALLGYTGWRLRIGGGVLRAGLLGAAFVGALVFMRGGATVESLAGRPSLWLVHQLAEVLLLALVAWVLLPGSARRWDRDGSRLAVVGGVGLALALSGGILAAARPALAEPVAMAGAWAAPAWLVGRGLAPGGGRRGGAARVAAAGWLAVTAVLPFHWVERTEARRVLAEAEMARLGSSPDPYLEFLLHRVGPVADSLHRAGAREADLLYRAWVETGLAAEGDPLWIALREPDGSVGDALSLGVRGDVPRRTAAFLPDPVRRGAATVRRVEGVEEIHYLAVTSLPGGGEVVVVVPPRRALRPASPLAPLFAAGGAWGGPLTLTPRAGPPEEPAGEVRWIRAERGWRGELPVRFPDGWQQAHFALPVPSPGIVSARAALLIFLDLAILLLAWGSGGVLRRGRELLPGGSPLELLAPVRTRITVTLLVFFLVPTATLGAFAYRALSGESERTARTLAEQALETAGSDALPATPGGASPGATHPTLLVYRGGALEAATSRQAVELGLYRSWVPPRVMAALSRGAVAVAAERDALVDWSYVVAYRRSAGGAVVAAPAPLARGAAAERRRELLHLLAFTVLAGVLLSLVLSVLVGRALAEPIGELRSAAERIGGGDLGVRLPEARRDEFGALFAAFNRMVARLQRARAALTRARRRTGAIVEEAATGVVALDRDGVVTLANRRATDLLGEEIRPGEPVPARRPLAREVRRWVAAFSGESGDEGERTVAVEGRRFRLRARRIAGGPEPGGLVVTLEDVTDELRSERILAWGEMAKQVAHEVKNPLTPVKLSVQHIRRAYEDARPDFGEILRRNIDAVLREIERLSTIVAGFSSFAAPGSRSGRPMEPVSVGEVVSETLALYAGGGGEVEYRNELPEGLPPVAARADELKEVLVNLLENARAAIDGWGVVSIEGEGDGRVVEIRVRDTGRGIPEAMVERVFEPRFSTRSSGGGLGLAIVRRLVTSWGGEVSAAAAPGEGSGTIIRIRLRAWDAEGSAPGAGGGDEASGVG